VSGSRQLLPHRAGCMSRFALRGVQLSVGGRVV